MKNLSHRPMVWITLFYGMGILLTEFCAVSLTLASFGVLGCLLLSLLMRRRPFLCVCALLLAFGFLGILTARSRQEIPSDHIERVVRYYRRHPAEMRGMIVSDVERRPFHQGIKISFVLDVRELKTPWGWRKKTGKALVNLFRGADLAYGDVLQLEGKLYRPFNFGKQSNFSYPEYLRARGIHVLLSVKKDSAVEILERGQGNFLKAVSLKIRDRCQEVLARYLSPNEAGLMQALLLGERSAIPKHIRELFVRTGTAHILAISGLHMGIVAGLVLVFLKIFPIPRRTRFFLAILILAGYAFFTGGRPSVVRATFMIAVFFASFIVEREGDHLNTLALAAFLLLLFNPFYLFDIGFQLSFVSVLSILLFHRRLKLSRGPKAEHARTDRRAKRAVPPILRWMMDSLMISLVVSLGVGGLIAYYFNIITPVTVAANLVVIPFLTLILILGFGLIVFGLFYPAAAHLFAVCLKLALNLMAGAAFLFDQVPGAHFYVSHVTFWHVAGYYLFLGVLFFVNLFRQR